VQGLVLELFDEIVCLSTIDLLNIHSEVGAIQFTSQYLTEKLFLGASNCAKLCLKNKQQANKTNKQTKSKTAPLSAFLEFLWNFGFYNDLCN
jgi:hypothetical protein